MLKLQIIVASTRPGRLGLAVAQWFDAHVRERGGWEVDFCDLAELNLPMMDEPNHPRLKQYVHQYTRDWSARVDAVDAFVVVTPEYNHGITAPLKNAIDYLHLEWHYKTMGFVSYGGVSAGTRGVEGIKVVAACLKMMPIFETVAIAGIGNAIDEHGQLKATDPMRKSADALLDELAKWATALKGLRAELVTSH